jgi:hypothetical protein
VAASFEIVFVVVLNLIFGRRDPELISDEMARRYQRALPAVSIVGFGFGLLLVVVGFVKLVSEG